MCKIDFSVCGFELLVCEIDFPVCGFDLVASAPASRVGSCTESSPDGDLLDEPTATFAYDLDRSRTAGEPDVVHARARERHGASSTRWQESYGDADGSSREIIREILAEPGFAPARDASFALAHDRVDDLVPATTDPRWVGSGRAVLDNEGHTVKQHEPFFGGSYDYEKEAELAEWGVAPIRRCDALGRLTCANPNDTVIEIPERPIHLETMPFAKPRGGSTAMGWDIVFHARFPDREDPAVRFRAVRSAIEARPGLEPLSSFAVLENGDPLRPIVDLNDVFDGAERVTEARVAACLSEMSSDSIGFCGTWRKRGRRGAAVTHTAIVVTALGARVKRPGRFPPPVDVTWDLGDSRRYTREGTGHFPTVDEVMADLVVLVDLGAESIHGLDADKTVSPEKLYAVFHRYPDLHRRDRAEPFAPIVIPEEAVRAAVEVRPDLRTVETSAGPIVYHEDLGEGRLTRFYDALEGAVEYAAGLQDG